MIVKCVRVRVEDFPFNSKVHLDHFGSRIRGAHAERGFDDLVIGKEYVVYAISMSQGYPYYFIEISDQVFKYFLRPAPCFEIVDGSVSKYWRYNHYVYTSKSGKETFRSTLGIKQWNKDGFVNRLIDGNPEEKGIFLDAAKKIKEEALQARANNTNK